MKKYKFFLFAFLLVQLSVYAQAPFTPVKYTTENKVPVLSEEYEYSILFRESDYVYTSPTKKDLSKRNHDYIAFMPGPKTDLATLYVSHETNDTSTILGDGGGGTVFSIRNKKGNWERAGANYNIDFSAVGNTFDNCGGLYIKETNRILSAEEFPAESNFELYKKGKGTRDTSDFNTLKRYENTGWIVEVDPTSRKAIKKLYALGRYSHESLCMTKDGSTLYMTDDYAAAVLFKFIAKTPYQFDEGTLYAYDQNRSDNPWIKLPGELDSLVHIRDIALKKGATAFMRLEWMTLVNDKIYITETGVDRFELASTGIQKDQVAFHLQSKIKNECIEYPFGAVIELDLKTQTLAVKISGGKGTRDLTKHFSNPDAITHVEYEGKTWLVICEDIIGKDKQRVLPKEGESPEYTNEVWWLDTSIPNPSIEDLQRFLIAVPGAECTGICFAPDGETIFLNIQHPSNSNAYPFDKTCTLVIHRKKRTRGKKIGKQRPQEGFGVTIPF
jgi:uncharacterized protein